MLKFIFLKFGQSASELLEPHRSMQIMVSHFAGQNDPSKYFDPKDIVVGGIFRDVSPILGFRKLVCKLDGISSPRSLPRGRLRGNKRFTPKQHSHKGRVLSSHIFS